MPRKLLLKSINLYKNPSKQRESPIFRLHKRLEAKSRDAQLGSLVSHVFFFFPRLMRRYVFLKHAMGHLMLGIDCLVGYESLKRLNSS